MLQIHKGLESYNLSCIFKNDDLVAAIVRKKEGVTCKSAQTDLSGPLVLNEPSSLFLYQLHGL